MTIQHKKVFVSRALGCLLLLITVLLVLEKSELLPASFHLQAATREAWIRVSKNHRHDDKPKPRRSEKKVRQMADRWYEELLAKHPEMAVTYKDVPDAENGFLKLLDFMDRYRNGDMLPDDIKNIINGSNTWDPTRFAAWLEENRELMDEITAIGLLPGQSVKGIDFDRYKFVNARLPSQASQLLLSQARLAMEKGDETSALTSVRAVAGLANHMDGVETPSLLCETVSVLLRLNNWKFATENLSSGGDTSAADLATWREALGVGAASPADLAHVFRGDWHIMARGYLLPQMLGGNLELLGEKDVKIPDPDALVESHISYFAEVISKMRASSLSGLTRLSMDPPTSHLSPESTEVIGVLFTGSSAWSKGWIRGQCEGALVEAAFAAAMGEEILMEPLTGKPFVFDQEAGTLAMPDDPILKEMGFKPVKVPKVAE